jgi:hypothetical protein
MEKNVCLETVCFTFALGTARRGEPEPRARSSTRRELFHTDDVF